MKKNLVIVCSLLLMTAGYTQQDQVANPDLIDPALNETQNIFLNNQAEALLYQTGNILSDYPPGWPEPAPRRSALLLLDGVLHDVYAPQRPPVQNFFKTLIKKAIDEIEQTKIINGARIWKLYNHGFLVRTKSVTIGFDLVSGKSVRVEEFSMGNSRKRGGGAILSGSKGEPASGEVTRVRGVEDVLPAHPTPF